MLRQAMVLEKERCQLLLPRRNQRGRGRGQPSGHGAGPGRQWRLLGWSRLQRQQQHSWDSQRQHLVQRQWNQLARGA